MSSHIQLESEAYLTVNLALVHSHGSVSHFIQDFSPFNTVRQLKEDMAGKLAVPVAEQIWKFNGKILKDEDTLHGLDVDPDDTIEVTSKLY